jgi:hypothetical protein
MSLSNTLGRCYVCNSDVQPRFFSFYDSTQQVSPDGKTITCLYAKETFRFCGESCWEVLEKPIVAGFNPVYQLFTITARCSICQKAVDRTQRHYVINIAEMEDISKPWLASHRTLDEREIAVFCPSCVAPHQGGALGTEAIEEDDLPVESETFAHTRDCGSFVAECNPAPSGT